MVWSCKTKIWFKCKSFIKDTDSFILDVKTEDEDIAKDVEAIFDTSNFELERLFPKGKNKKVTRLIKDKLCGLIMKEFVKLRAKINSYLKDNNEEDKKTKGTKIEN